MHNLHWLNFQSDQVPIHDSINARGFKSLSCTTLIYVLWSAQPRTLYHSINLLSHFRHCLAKLRGVICQERRSKLGTFHSRLLPPPLSHTESLAPAVREAAGACVGLKAYKKACIGGLDNSQPTGSEPKLSITYSVCAFVENKQCKHLHQKV